MRWRPSTPALIALSTLSLLAVALLPGGARAPFMADAHHAAAQHGASSLPHGAMSMPMSFELSFDTILWFKPWHPRTAAAWLLSALVLAALGVAHEALASFRVALSRRAQKQQGGLYSALIPGGGGGGGVNDLAPLGTRALHSSLYALNLATGYLLMLAVMTFNVGYFFTVVLSMGAGHLLFFNRTWHLALPRAEACCETSSAHE